MTYTICILENAQDDLDWFRRNDRTSYIKCFTRIKGGLDNRAIALCFSPNIYQLVVESRHAVSASQYPVGSLLGMERI